MEAKEISVEGLEILVSQEVGFPIKLAKKIIVDRWEKEMIVVESQELKELTGIMKPVYESVRLANFGGGFCSDGKGYWLPIHFSFKYKNAGSNGTILKDFWYMFETKEWKTL